MAREISKVIGLEAGFFLAGRHRMVDFARIAYLSPILIHAFQFSEFS